MLVGQNRLCLIKIIVGGYYLKIDDIKKPEDVLRFMNENIDYGWIDIDGNIHRREMKDFRTRYRVSSTEESLQHGVGTCIEQVFLMHTCFDRLNLTNKMYCCRIYEPDDFGNLEEEEHMHCFLLYEYQGKIYHIEHPNFYRIGIFEYDNEEEAIETIEKYYMELRGGKASPTTEFYAVEPGLSFGQFNRYINSLDRQSYLQKG
jgi:hypothetical protein